MSIIERGTLTIRRQAVPCGRVYSYVARCGACDLQVESLPGDMPGAGLASLRGPYAPVGQHRGDGDGRPWLIITGNDANGGNFAPFVRCGACRSDRR